jgi:hypothetical protein
VSLFNGKVKKIKKLIEKEEVEELCSQIGVEI